MTRLMLTFSKKKEFMKCDGRAPVVAQSRLSLSWSKNMYALTVSSNSHAFLMRPKCIPKTSTLEPPAPVASEHTTLLSPSP